MNGQASTGGQEEELRMAERALHYRSHSAKKQSVKHGIRSDNCSPVIMERLEQINKQVTECNAKAKQQFYGNKFSRCRKGKETWRCINEILNIKKSKRCDAIILRYEDTQAN